MKRSFSLVLAVVLVLGALSGSALARTKIEWWTADGGEKAITGWMDKVVAGFEKENPDIEVVRVDMQDEDMKVGLKSSMAAGMPPAMWRSWGGGVLKSYVAQGQVADVTPIIKKLGRKIPAGALSTSTWGGKHYGLPYTTWVGHIYINRDLFAKAGVKVPDASKNETWTWEQFIEAIKAFKQHDIIPIAVGGKENWELSFYYMYLVDRIGGSELFAKTLNREAGYSFGNPAFIEAGKRIRELVEVGAFEKGFLGMGYSDAQRYFFSGQAAMYLMGTWLIGDLRKQAPDLNLDIIRFPSIPGGKGDPTMLLGAPQTIHAVSENVKPEQKAAALKLLEYLARDEVINDFVKDVGDLIVFNVPLPKGAYDPVIEKVIKEIGKAGHLQMAWDQYSPPQFAAAHLEAVGALFAGSITPQEMGKRQETTAKDLQAQGQLPL
ncbi:MAG: extracellular solute-binding protein [Firmicutes bacterium]|nr:extracellular solute-binding protein [Bacillota bacterium]